MTAGNSDIIAIAITELTDFTCRRGDLLRVAGMFESEPSLLGISAHLLLVGRKPTTPTPATR